MLTALLRTDRPHVYQGSTLRLRVEFVDDATNVDQAPPTVQLITRPSPAGEGGITAVFGQTTVASGSNGQALPQPVIDVASTASYSPTGGTFFVGGLNVPVTYSGLTPTSFTGCAGGTGTLATGQAITPSPVVSFTQTTSGTRIVYEALLQMPAGAQPGIWGYAWQALDASGNPLVIEWGSLVVEEMPAP